jgi:GDP-4-dehydro-6-deoxy-D-mannose reductase
MSRVTASGHVLDDGPILVTGAAGFAAGHLMEELRLGPGDAAADARDFTPPAGAARHVWRLPSEPPADMGGFRYIFHLAGLSSAAAGFRTPSRMYSVNTAGTASVLDLAAGCPGCRVLLVSSADVYGSSPRDLDEDSPLAPVGPYGGSKAAAEAVALQYAAFSGLDLVRARPFPHFGPGQEASFALPSFCRRIIEARRAGTGWVAAGNLAPVRDFTPVEDTVSAYALLAAEGASGGAYNVCSGSGISVGELLVRLMEVSGGLLEVRTDASLLRPADVSRQVGDPSRLTALGWRRRRGLDDSLRALYEWWEGHR